MHQESGDVTQISDFLAWLHEGDAHPLVNVFEYPHKACPSALPWFYRLPCQIVAVFAGSDTTDWGTFAEAAWRSDALQTFARLVSKMDEEGTGLEQVYRRVLRDVLMAAMGCFMLFPSNLPGDTLEHVLGVISGIHSGAEPSHTRHHVCQGQGPLLGPVTSPLLLLVFTSDAPCTCQTHVNGLREW